MSDLTFKEVAQLNLDRCQAWHPGGIMDWTPTDWACAMAGEAGEVCNAIKKLRRTETGVSQTEEDEHRHLQDIAMEIGDTILYLDLLAQRLGIDVETAVRDTFNRVSKREGLSQIM